MHQVRLGVVLCTALLAVCCFWITPVRAIGVTTVVFNADSLEESSNAPRTVHELRGYVDAEGNQLPEGSWSSRRRVTIWVKVWVILPSPLVRVVEYDHADPPNPSQSEIDVAMAAAWDGLRVKPEPGKNTAVIPIRITIEIAPPDMK